MTTVYSTWQIPQLWFERLNDIYLTSHISDALNILKLKNKKKNIKITLKKQLSKLVLLPRTGTLSADPKEEISQFSLYSHCTWIESGLRTRFVFSLVIILSPSTFQEQVYLFIINMLSYCLHSTTLSGKDIFDSWDLFWVSSYDIYIYAFRLYSKLNIWSVLAFFLGIKPMTLAFLAPCSVWAKRRLHLSIKMQSKNGQT